MCDLSHEHILTDPHLAQIFRGLRLSDMPKCTIARVIGAASKDERASELCVQFGKTINDVLKYILKFSATQLKRYQSLKSIGGSTCFAHSLADQKVDVHENCLASQRNDMR
jgi:hypothetical protein